MWMFFAINYNKITMETITQKIKALNSYDPKYDELIEILIQHEFELLCYVYDLGKMNGQKSKMINSKQIITKTFYEI
jgi:DNA integrity scanning protein DisA with diadenylate cyclase activity